MFLKILLNVALVALVALAGLYWFNPGIARKIVACQRPITYKIGSFDRRFNISQKEFLTALNEAEKVWEKPLEKELFAYDPENGELRVNLVYDYRQETTKTLSTIESTVKVDEATYKALRAEYLSLREEYQKVKSDYELRIKLFNEKNDIYEKNVESWNRSTRNSKERFEELEKTRLGLEAEAEELKKREEILNGMVREINALVARLNYLAKSLNLKTETYNEIGAARGESFTGGVYSSKEGEEEINIYEFSGRNKLVRVLAHELGHALGLEHVEDKESIMYYLNKDDKDILSGSDLTALKTLCRTGQAE